MENTVGLVTHHILSDMLEMTFYSLDELNTELWKRMEEENKVNFQGCNYSRWDLYIREEKDTLLPLPATEYQFFERKMVKVYQDFSFVFDEVHYTMPRKYLKSILDVRANATTLHVYNENGDFIRDHVRSYKPKSWVIIDEDLPLEYREYGKWSVLILFSDSDFVWVSLDMQRKASLALKLVARRLYPEADAATGM